MCYHVSLNKPKDTIENRYKAKIPQGLNYEPKEHISAFEGMNLLIITNENNLLINSAKWGIIPSWAVNKPDFNSNNTLNAKIESIFEKPSFKDIAVNQRALIITDGFFEWQLRNKQKIPWKIKSKNSEFTSLAGIFNKNSRTDSLEFSIITVPSVGIMSEIHNSKLRMPLILHGELEALWLGNQFNTKGVIDIINSSPPQELDAIQISSDFFRKSDGVNKKLKKSNQENTQFNLF